MFTFEVKRLKMTNTVFLYVGNSSQLPSLNKAQLMCSKKDAYSFLFIRAGTKSIAITIVKVADFQL